MDNYPRCWACNQHWQEFGPQLADAAVPLAYAFEYAQGTINQHGQHQTHFHLRAYKWDPPYRVDACGHDLSVMLMIAIAFHRPCIEALVRRPWDCWAVVPSSRNARQGEHPLAQMVAGIPLNLPRVHLALAGVPSSDRLVRADRYVAVDPPSVAGRHVVLFEDTWVSGASAQSAVLALRQAGAAAVTVVCLARWLEENTTYPLEAQFFAGLTTPYDARVCPASGAVCGRPWTTAEGLAY